MPANCLNLILTVGSCRKIKQPGTPGIKNFHIYLNDQKMRKQCCLNHPEGDSVGGSGKTFEGVTSPEISYYWFQCARSLCLSTGNDVG